MCTLNTRLRDFFFALGSFIHPPHFSLSFCSMDKVKVLSLMLHAADISHPAKAWPLHYRWTHSLMEEFFRQVGNMGNFISFSSCRSVDPVDSTGPV